MSCGNHHVMPCSTVQAIVFLYLDNEPLPCQPFDIVQHFEECPPCYQEFLVEQMLKERLAQMAMQQQTLVQMEATIYQQISSIRIEITQVGEDNL